jgi:hypothetical protein
MTRLAQLDVGCRPRAHVLTNAIGLPVLERTMRIFTEVGS